MLGTAGGDQGMMGGGLGVLTIIALLEKKIGSCRKEGVGRVLRCDDRNSVAVLGIETA